jgi:Mg2+-importing ATPase
LIASVTATSGVAIILPYSSLAQTLGLVPMPISFFLFVFVAAGTYLGLVSWAKRRVLRDLASGPVTGEPTARQTRRLKTH